MLRDGGGRVALVRRPDKGLLGGMLGFPGDGWDGAGGQPPLPLAWERVAEVRHTFTHFRLHITPQALRIIITPENFTQFSDNPVGFLQQVAL